MDIRRLALWEGRYATYMSNGSFSVVIEDQGEVAVELSAKLPNGARISPLSLPYFRGTGSGVFSDENRSWWASRQALYQAGGAYLSFPESNEDIVTSSNTYWMLRRYGTEDDYNGVWKYSEMKSREDGNKYHLGKIDLILPNHNMLYSAIRITNTGESELRANPAWYSMLSSPLVESGTMINTDARFFSAYSLNRRESGKNRFVSGRVFDELKKAPLATGGTADASVVPNTPTGTYDFIIGKLSNEGAGNWITVINPRSQLVYITYSPKAINDDEYDFPNAAICENYYGRMDAPWALFDGATPIVQSLTVGFNSGPKGTRNLSIAPGKSKTILIANGFYSYDNPRIGMGFYSNEISADGFCLKRTKSYAFLSADTAFKTLRKISKRIFFLGSDYHD